MLQSGRHPHCHGLPHPADDGFNHNSRPRVGCRDRQSRTRIGRHAAALPVYSPDGKRIACCGYDGVVRIYDAESGSVVGKLTGHEGQVSGVAYRPDGAWLATTGDDGIRVFDAATGDLLTTIKDHDAAVNFVAFQHDGQRFASTDNNGVLHLWDTAALENPTVVPFGSILRDRGGGGASAIFTPNGAHLLCSVIYGDAMLYNADTLVADRPSCHLPAAWK